MKKLTISIITIFIIAIGVLGYFQINTALAKQNEAMYTLGAQDGIQYRNSLIIQDIEKQGYTEMTILGIDNKTQGLILIPYNPNANPQYEVAQ